MKKTTSILAVLIVLLVFALAGTYAQEQPASQDGKKPKIRFSEKVFHFGDVYQGKKVTHVFKVYNDGDDTLIINSVNASCGCTAVMTSNKEIAPGQHGEITVTFDTNRFEGERSKTVTVISNDPQTPKVTLTIKANILVAVKAEPRRLLYHKINREELPTKEIFIYGEDEEERLEITGVSAQPDIFLFNWKKDKREGKKGQLLRVEFKETPPIGSIRGNIKIQTNNTKQPKIDIYFYGEIEGDILIVPKRVFFRPFENGEKQMVTITLENRRDKPFKVLEVTDNGGICKTNVREELGGAKWVIDLVIEDKVPEEKIDRNRFQGEVIVKTDHPDYKETSIPYVGFLRQPDMEQKQKEAPIEVK